MRDTLDRIRLRGFLPLPLLLISLPRVREGANIVLYIILLRLSYTNYILSNPLILYFKLAAI